jgi:FtsZ-binding cell division protein ZapB
MNGLSGMEKFSHLEDKIYLTVEFVKKLREEKEILAAQAETLKSELISMREQHRSLEAKVTEMLSERDAIQLKVEAMLDAMTIIDPEVAEAVGR